MVFNSEFLTLDDGSVISMLCIERIKFLEEGDEELALISTLKDDCLMGVTMISGEKHVISMKEFTKSRYQNLKSKKEHELLRISIVDRWKHLLSRK